MDEDLRRLQRAVEADPSDVEAAQAYDQALLRCGRRDEVLARYQAKYACLPPAEQIPTTCVRCQRPVEDAVVDPQELKTRIAGGSCLRLPERQLSRVVELFLGDPDLHSAREEGGPCLLVYLDVALDQLLTYDPCHDCGMG